jgi:hypothetical protein
MGDAARMAENLQFRTALSAAKAPERRPVGWNSGGSSRFTISVLAKNASSGKIGDYEIRFINESLNLATAASSILLVGCAVFGCCLGTWERRLRSACSIRLLDPLARGKGRLSPEVVFSAFLIKL